MAIREVRVEGDEVLLKTSKKVKQMTKRTSILIEDMLDTMYETDGVGLAAPQVGILKRIVVMDVGDGPIVLVNPEIIFEEGSQTGDEGCLSVPGKTGKVTRPQHVICKALNENMEEITVDGTDLLARCICHELDHLDGILYVSKVEGKLNSLEEV